MIIYMNTLYCRGCGNQLSNKYMKFQMSINKGMKAKDIYDSMEIINMCCKNELISSRPDINYRLMINKLKK